MRIGLTGGIGSGKSTVARLFVAHGAVLVDTDAIARELTQPGGAAINSIRSAFGSAFIDAQGALDRAQMRELAFADAAAKKRLESILHPLIVQETEAQARASTSQLIVFDVPLLVESRRWRSLSSKVLVVDCRETTQVDRVTLRSGWAADAVRAVIAAQATRAERRAAADAVIFNECITPVQLATEVQSLLRRWLVRAP